jgi:CRP-like cAMP-binding protein
MVDTRVTTRVDVFAGLSAEDVVRFQSGCRMVTLAPGESLFSEGDDGDRVYIVRSGRVRITKAISLDSRKTLAVVGVGGVFGELAMVDAEPRSASAEAIERTEVLELGREQFERLIREAPELGAKILGRFAAALAERLRVTNELLRDTIAWGLDVSGAKDLNLDGLVKLNPDVEVRLSSGQDVVGKLLKVEKHAHGVDLIVKEDRDERLFMIPYHAVVAIAFPGDHFAATTSIEA